MTFSRMEHYGSITFVLRGIVPNVILLKAILLNVMALYLSACNKKSNFEHYNDQSCFSKLGKSFWTNAIKKLYELTASIRTKQNAS
jgi:hypothetical protein